MSRRNVLSGKLALVTGGGSGVGRAVCELFALNGARIIIADEKQAEATLELVGGVHRGHLAFTIDVSDPEEVDEMSESIVDHYQKPPSVVVHAAGVMRHVSDVDWSSDIFQQIIGVDLKATYLINRKFSLLMRQHRIPGSIVNVSSIATGGVRLAPEYATAKAGQVGWSLSLAKELAPYEIRCNLVHPGSNEAQQGDLWRQNFSTKPSPNPVRKVKKFPEMMRDDPKVHPQQRMGRPATPSEVANICLFLASDKSAPITQCCYDVGWRMKTKNYPFGRKLPSFLKWKRDDD